VEDGIVRRLRARVGQARERYEWADHVARAGQRYFEQRGNHFAAAITFFSILTAVPLLMVAFALASYVLWFHPELLAELEQGIAAKVPAGLSELLNPIIETAIDQRNTVAGVGIVGALWSGVWWMSNLREAVSAQWGLPAPHPAALQRLVYDLRELVGLGAALGVSFALTALGTGFTEAVLWALGVPDEEWARVLLRALGVVLGLAANWLIFAWAITRLPRMEFRVRSVARAALLGAVGFEALKQGGAIYLDAITGSPSGAVFGSLLGLLLFGYLIARLVLLVTAWAATARGNQVIVPVSVPGPAVIRPEIVVRRGASPTGVGAVLVVGLVAGALLRGSRRGAATVEGSATARRSRRGTPS
jgi:membrane protein